MTTNSDNNAARKLAERILDWDYWSGDTLSDQIYRDVATALLSALDRNEQLEKELDQSDRETEHFARLACDDLGKNPPVWWKDKAEELQSRVEQLERVLEAARAFVAASKVDLTRVGSPGFGVVVRAVDQRFEELERLVE